MRLGVRLSAQLLALGLALLVIMAPGFAFARAGGGSSMGSRGSMTFSAPPSTSTAPMGAAPMQRSITPQSPSYGQPAQGYAPGFGSGMRSPFASGLMGGLIGAGIGGMLFGHGFFGGIGGIGSVFGLLIQLALIFFVVRFLFRMFSNSQSGARQPFFAGLGNMGRGAMMGGGGMGPRPVPMGGRANVASVPIVAADYQAFEQLLKNIQAAWSAQDIGGLRAMATPEMVSYFGEQLAQQVSQGVRNAVTDVSLVSGDLSQAWTEQGRDYATVAMRFSMIDVTRDGSGRVVDGSPTEHVTATEIWTFVRSRGGQWILSAIQQTR
jgi:predicted lipid-binding transport protein (Tim44 family)